MTSHSTLSRLAEAITGIESATPQHPPKALPLSRGVIATSHPTVTVYLNGNNVIRVPADNLGSYLPVVNDVVEILSTGTRLIILGKSIPGGDSGSGEPPGQQPGQPSTTPVGPPIPTPTLTFHSPFEAIAFL